MPGDKIIRKGERGTDMYFVQEGIVEILLPKKGAGPNEKQFTAIFLERGAYFGEIALISNSKRTVDVNAFEFCILESFNKDDYESLAKDSQILLLD